MSSLNGCGPITHRLADRFLQGRLPRGNWNHLGPKQLHSPHVRGLSLHINLSHVDSAIEAETSTDCCSSHSMLAGSGLSNDSTFSQPACQQSLSDSIVDLVSPGMEKVLALQVDFGSSHQVTPAFGVIERRGPSTVIS